MKENYIKRLERENREKDERIAQLEADLIAFEAHVSSPKFTGTDESGDRRDWIATGDVTDRLRNIRVGA
jgi:hypothetical protein